MNRRSMILRPLIMVLVLITILVSFSGASYAFQKPVLYFPPTIQVTVNPQSVGAGQVTGIIVKTIDISAWTSDGQILDTDVELKYSGPGNVVMGSTSGKLDNNNQYSTTFKADKAGEYTINATLGALVEWSNGSADFVSASNSTKVIVTSGGMVINPKASLAPVTISATPSPSPSSDIHNIGQDLNLSGFAGLPGNTTSSPTPQPSNDTAGKATPPAQPSPASSPNAQDISQPAASASTVASSPSLSATPQPGGNGDNGSTTTYLLIAVVVLIAIVGILGGYILGKGKK